MSLHSQKLVVGVSEEDLKVNYITEHTTTSNTNTTTTTNISNNNNNNNNITKVYLLQRPYKQNHKENIVDFVKQSLKMCPSKKVKDF